MRIVLATTLIVSLFGLALSAQESPKKPSTQPVARGPALTGEDGNAVAGVRLSRAEVKAVVHGNLAQATMLITFANDQPRVLGGNLVFPLPEGATVTGYGLEIDGQIVDGVAVEKERARVIYESEIHKRVDPGLVEQVEGNVFRTRLYPIPPHGTRSIKLEYATQIEQGMDGPTLALPLGLGDALEDLTIRVEAPDATAAPIVTRPAMEGLKFAKAERGFVAAASAKNAKCGEELVIALPELAARSVAVGRRAKFARTIEELQAPHEIDHLPAQGSFETFEHYFVVTDSPVEPARKSAQLKTTRIGVVWDASLSRADADHGRELKLLESALNRLGNPETDLIIVRDEIEVRPFFAAGAAGTASLIEAIKALPYDGATNLGALKLPKNLSEFGTVKSKKPPADYDLFLVFTDGFGNLGADRPARAQAPVYAICDDIRANHALLSAICQESGGSYFNLKRTTDEQALAAIGQSPFTLISVERKADEIADVYPPVGTEVRGRFTVSGKLLVPQATLTLHYGVGQQVTSSQTFTINSAAAEDGTLIPRFWAQQKAAALSLFPDKNADELTRLGRQFNLVTPNTSLLVLETVDQYVQYRVVPPRSRPAIYQVFLARIEQQRREEARSQEQKLQQVAALWDQRVKWWEQEFKYPANLKMAPDVAQNAPSTQPAGGGVLANGGQLSPTTLPPPSPVNLPTANGTVHREAIDRQASSHAGDVTAGHPAPNADARAPQQASTVVASRNPAPNAPSNFEDRAFTGALNAVGPGESGVPVRRAPEAEARIDQVTFGLLPKRLESGRDEGEIIKVAIQEWGTITPHLSAMKAVPAEKAYEAYLAQRKNCARSPAFYFDCADYLMKVGQQKLAIRVLTDIVELELHDARLLRVAAHRLNQIGQRERAIDLFEKILKLRPEEPQSYRDLALALADRADESIALAPIELGTPLQENVDRAVADYVRSLELLNKVVLGNWPRFPEIELPVLMEANDIAAKVGRLRNAHDFHNPIDPRLQKNLDLDVRVVMTWDADQTDVDLWVTEPSNEKCFYSHNRTTIGGLLSHDFTDGYGPEEYCLRKLMPGQYVVQANYYGSHQQELTGPATVQATIISNFGRPGEKRRTMSLRLSEVQQIVDVGTITLGGAEPKK